MAAQELGVDTKALSPEARERLIGYGWPGNVRELVNLCRRLTVLAPGSEIRIEDLPSELGNVGPVNGHDDDWTAVLARWADQQAHALQRPLLEDAMPAFERTLIRVALKHTQGHRQEAARLLGWGRNTLTRKLKELGMDEPGED
jgi:two-component system nitrogen regulation response regulator GlnG